MIWLAAPDPKLDRRCFIVRDANGHAGSVSVTARIAVWVARVFCLRWRYSSGCYSPGSLRYLE